VKKNKMLEIDINLVTGTTHSTWVFNPSLKPDVIRTLYPKRNNCKNLEGYVPELVNQISGS